MAIASVEKAFHLLEYLVESRQPVALASAAQACGLPKPSAVRLLRTLQSLGYVARPAGSRDYLIGPKARLLAGADPHDALKEASAPILRDLHVRFNETVNLGVLSGTQVQYVACLETTQALRMIVSPGECDPWQRTALGRAVAAGMDKKQLATLIKDTAFSDTPPDVRAIDATGLMAELSKTRRRGYAEEIGEAVPGAGCLAVGLARIGFPDAAISVAVPLQRLNRERRTEIASALTQIF